MYTELTDYGLTWAVWLAWAGLAVAAALLLMLMIKNQKVGALISCTLLRAPKLSARLMFGFSLIAIVSMLTLAFLLAVNAASALGEERVARLEGQAANAANSVATLIEQKVSGIVWLAGHLGTRARLTETELRDVLLHHHLLNQDFVSMWMARPDGQVVAATAASDGKVKTWPGPQTGVAFMESFQATVAEGSLHVASVSKGAAPAFDPMIAISVPVLNSADVPKGYLQAYLNLRDLAGATIEASVSPGTHTVIVNAANQVVLASSGLVLRPLASLASDPLIAAAGSSDSFGFSASIEMTGGTGRYVAVERPMANGWRVFAIAPLAGIVGFVMMHFGFALVAIPVVLLLARGLARVYGGAVAEPLKKLDESLDIFDIERTVSVIPPVPEDAAEEVLEVYDGVRQLMKNSRDAYGNMLRAVQEGAELRQELENVVSYGNDGVAVDIGTTHAPVLDVPVSDVDDLDPEATFTGRLDPVTKMAGQKLFEDFLSQAWTVGVTDGRPVSMLLFGITNSDEEMMQSIAESLAQSTGRVLDLVARIAVDEFIIVLPDTELKGALAVAERTLKHVLSQLPANQVRRKSDDIAVALAVASGQEPAVNVAVVSIVPTADRDPRSFTLLAGRVLAAARKKGHGKIAYISSDGKVGWV